MTYRGLQIVVVTPAGRRRYLELLIPQVVKYNIVDEYQLWVNTNNVADKLYMHSMDGHGGIVKLYHLPPGKRWCGCASIHHFFKECVRPKTLYIRFDDDVVLLDTQQNFEKFLDYRIENPQYFLVFPVILNNAMCSHLLQRQGKLNTDKGISAYTCEDPVGFKCGKFAANIHEQIIHQKQFDLSRFHTENWIFWNNEHVSINCIAWTGEGMMGACGGQVNEHEETDLTVTIPKRIRMHNAMFGGYCCVHYAFGWQRESGMGDDRYLKEYASFIQ